MKPARIAVIGAGIGGLTAAIDLAAAGCAVTVLERLSAPGGKMRQVFVDGAAIDAGPTVLTMRWVFDQIFADAGTSLAAHLDLRAADILARHAWGPGETLDLHADAARSAEAIAAFAGQREADGFVAFTRRSRAVYDTLDKPFLRAGRPTPFGLVRQAGIGPMLGIDPFRTLMASLARDFADPRLRQLFGRYATYCGSSPYLAPATLMLVAHVEREGVWLVEGGMHRLAAALAALASRLGAVLHYDRHVERIETAGGRVSGLILQDGERLPADAVVFNGDPQALSAGLLGEAAARATPRTPPARRSLSALTWAMRARAEGFPLSRHNVFFSRDYRAEFDVLGRGHLPPEPTVYVCAQDRADDGAAPDGPERLLVLVNAPAAGDTEQPATKETDACADRTFAHLASCGLHVDRRTAGTVQTGPAAFDRMFPATGGALYGPAVHGPWATFQRPGSRTRLPGLYLAGGATHPGAGVPMAALSGRLAAHAVLDDGVSMRRSHPVAIAGGISTH